MVETLRLILTKEQKEIIKAVLYFDIFEYPLTREELFENVSFVFSKTEFDVQLDSLTAQHILREKSGFILNADAADSIITKRLKGNAGAAQVMPLAYDYSLKIAKFPFVEAVCLSGGLSKNYYDEKGDIDYFIITTPNRLWLCRTLLILRYKLLPKQKKKFWCTNYFVSSDNLQLPDINRFTATELAHLIPTVNYALYAELLHQNSWYKTKFPNRPLAANTQCIETPKPFLKTLAQKLLGGRIGSLIDTWLLNLTLDHWQKKYPELSAEDFELQFRSQKNVCKRHTKGFQNRVLALWQEKQKVFEETFRISLQS